VLRREESVVHGQSALGDAPSAGGRRQIDDGGSFIFIFILTEIVFYSQSAVIASTLESEFPDHTPLLAPAGTPLRKRQDDLNRLERTLFSRWMQWLTSGWMDGQMRSGFEEVLDVVETELAFDATGPYFCGEELTLIDITFTPFLERMAASLAYYKGFRMEGNGGRWPNIDNWYRAMAQRTDTYANIKSVSIFINLCIS
jgi:glutathione S-transferase